MAKSPHDYTTEEKMLGLAFLDAYQSHSDKYAKAAKASGINKAALIFWDSAPAVEEQAEPIQGDGRKRPMPPEEMTHKNRKPDIWKPAPELWEWMYETFLVSSGALYNPKHWHLKMSKVGVLWTNVEKKMGDHLVVGEASLPQIKGGKWQQKRWEDLNRRDFGFDPTFIITLDSVWAARASDREFCRVCDHELFHCAIKTNKDGEPMITEGGEPFARMRPHDVEEFTDMADLYGVEACAGDSVRFVAAANRRPKWTDADIEAACGPD